MSKPYTVDLGEVLNLLNEQLAVTRDLHGTETTVDYDRGRGRHNDPEQAAMSRDLLRLAELSRLIAQEYLQVYWSFKGYEDARFADVTANAG